MKIKLLLLFGLVFHGFALAESGYEVLVKVKNAKSDLVFPAFEISNTNKRGTTQVGGCTYLGKLTERDAASLMLVGQMSCTYEDGDSSMDMPVFILSSKGDQVSMVLGDDGTEMWKYSVEIKLLP